MKRRAKPASPETILQREAERRLAAAASSRDPASWGLPVGLMSLPANDDVAILTGRGVEVRARRRSDAFEILQSTGSLEVREYIASQRYWADWCASAGIVERETLRLEVIQGAGSAEGVTQSMIDAGKRLKEVHRHVGRATERLLTALVEPLVMRGEIRVWRVLVERATGVAERHAQAALVVHACRDLAYAYDDIDEAHRRRRPSKQQELS